MLTPVINVESSFPANSPCSCSKHFLEGSVTDNNCFPFQGSLCYAQITFWHYNSLYTPFLAQFKCPYWGSNRVQLICCISHFCLSVEIQHPAVRVITNDICPLDCVGWFFAITFYGEKWFYSSSLYLLWNPYFLSIPSPLVEMFLIKAMKQYPSRCLVFPLSQWLSLFIAKTCETWCSSIPPPFQVGFTRAVLGRPYIVVWSLRVLFSFQGGF